MKFNTLRQVAVFSLAVAGLTNEAHAEARARNYHIEWSSGGVRYESLVELSGPSGWLRIRALDPASGKHRLVQMLARIDFDGLHYILSGKQPRDPFSGRRDPYPWPTNWWFSSAPGASQTVFTVDQHGDRTYGRCRELLHKGEIYAARRAFAWESYRGNRSRHFDRRPPSRNPLRAQDLVEKSQRLNPICQRLWRVR